MKKFTFISILLLTFTSFANAKMNIAPFYGVIDYANASKDKGSNYGIYLNNQDFQAVLEYQDIKFIPDINSTDTNNTDFTQTNLALSYMFNDYIYGSLNYINSSNKQYDGAYTALIGLNKKFDSFNLGLDYSYSDYGNTIVDTVNQLTPYVSFSFGDYNSLMGHYYTKITYDYILPDANDNNLSSEYTSFGISLTQNKGDFQNSIRYYFGDHIFSVRDRGLSVQNFEEIYEDSLSLSSKYNINSSISVQLSYIQRNYKEYGESSKSKLNNTLLFLYFKF